MQIVIDINDEIYKEILSGKDGWSNYVHGLIRTGISIPKGHGRLIDADALWKKWVFDAIGKQEIDEAPTIIEAESEETDADSN